MTVVQSCFMTLFNMYIVLYQSVYINHLSSNVCSKGKAMHHMLMSQLAVQTCIRQLPASSNGEQASI